MRWMPLAFLLALNLLPASARAEIDFMRCPDQQDGQTLADFDIFDGPPDQKQDLVPDEDGWSLDSYQSEGHKVYLVCRYGKAETPVQFEIPHNIDFCSMESGNNVSCR